MGAGWNSGVAGKWCCKTKRRADLGFIDLEKGGPFLCMIRSNNSFSYITISKVIEEVLEGTNVDSKPINFDNKGADG